MNTKVASAKVVMARVYANGCVLTCAGEVRLEAGFNTVLVDCVPASLAEDSVKVRMPAPVSMMSVSVTHEAPPPSGDEPDLAARVEDFERKIARVDARVGNRTSQKELWLARAKAADQQGADLDAIERYLEHLPEHLDALDDELSNLADERKKLQRGLVDAQESLAERNRRAGRGMLCLRVDAPSQMDARFEVDLRSKSASWCPVYDVLVNDLDEPLDLRLRAEVRQWSDLEWNDVRLVLSTAAPAARAGLPQLRPLRLRKRPEVSPPRFKGMAMHAMSMRSAPMEEAVDFEDTAAFEAPLVEATPPQAQAEELTNSVEYTVPGSWSVTSQGDPALVEVQTIELAATYSWRAVPAVDDAVYMVATLDGMLPPEAMGQKASVYLEGEFCGTVVLDEPSDDDAFEVSLGTDARMRASRKLVRQKAANSLLRGRRIEETAYELEVWNHRDEDVSLVLLDQVPVSEEKDIVVEAGDCEGARLDAQTGQLRWELPLAPNSCARRCFAYTVSHPKDMQVQSTRDQPRQKWCPECGAPVDDRAAFCLTCGASIR